MDEAARLRTQAAKCRELASQARDTMTATNLRALADDYDAEADGLESGPGQEPPPKPIPE